MKKTICINPVDETVLIRVEALNLLNEFKRLGFDTRSKFVNVVIEVLPEYNNVKMINELYHFWQTRVFLPEVNNRLAQVIEKLKSE